MKLCAVVPATALGVAQVASSNIAIPEYRIWCEERLVALFSDHDVEVRSESASCFSHLRDEVLDRFGDLLKVFCESRAYQENSSSILHILEQSLGQLPGTTCFVCERFLDHCAKEALDIQTRGFRGSYTVAKLIFRTYQQHQDDEWTSPSLDLIDRLCLEGIPGTVGEFEHFER